MKENLGFKINIKCAACTPKVDAVMEQLQEKYDFDDYSRDPLSGYGTVTFSFAVEKDHHNAIEEELVDTFTESKWKFAELNHEMAQRHSKSSACFVM